MNTSHTEDRGVLPDEVALGETLTRTCVGCGTEYEWTSREGYQWPTSYCTRKCKRKSSPGRRVKLDSPDAQLGEGMVLLICGRCEMPFGWTPRGDGTLRPPTYHSESCAERASQQRKKDRIRAGRAQAVTAEQRKQQTTDRERGELIAAMSAAARELLLPASHCATCGKVASPTKEAAKEAKRAIEQRARRTNEVRYFQCPDGWWHWTRMDATLSGFRAHHAERLMTESPASLRHRGRGAWNHLGETR